MAKDIPLWRGFNVVDLFSTSVRWKEHFPMNDGVVAEKDFAMIRELGFNFVRIPMSYLFFGKGMFGRTPDEKRLFLIDRVVDYGKKYQIHVLLAFHRAPGYCVTASSPFDFPEKGDLFSNSEDQEDFVTWWRTLAERYRHVPADALSFNLVNEPTCDRCNHEISPGRLIHVEGPLRMVDGNLKLVPAPASIATLPNVVNSVHFYSPVALTHHRCPWVPIAQDAEPLSWPYHGSGIGPDGDRLWDRDTIREQLKPFLDLAEAGHAIHVGEMGAYSALPHDVYISYCKDLMNILAQYRVGYAMWNFRGPFGILDNRRTDTDYFDFHGHKLDQKLLDVTKPKTGWYKVTSTEMVH
ncbi:glycoside hydrolase family 5 protein [Zasmidium cellare ATCC 36951]|uniref:Glycoside hydrolase family 5 protein n=1 Tax=Zasmidium cellare ATCC 36951 TaxID=1080233 RepID=A0A6A6CTB4_ZASCE|nr:glycoside hydrolase family 5 protein [Zasmidium cellare ATCC 36951]KAF2169400.1 glycoside hydrolase family 5 protein [Zasmidium cellare ATCC 36951]